MLEGLDSPTKKPTPARKDSELNIELSSLILPAQVPLKSNSRIAWPTVDEENDKKLETITIESDEKNLKEQEENA